MESILFSFETVSSLEIMKGSAKEFIKDLSLLDLVSRYEKDIMTEALKKSTSIRKAAKKLKICHTTLLNKMKKLKIHPKS